MPSSTFSSTLEQLKLRHAAQPLFAVTDDAYDRMLKRLQDGEPFVKSFLGTCPHSRKADCRCEYYKNILRDGRIVRDCDGIIKPVVRASDLLR